MTGALQRIEFQGGGLSFRIPADWHAIVESEGSGVYYSSLSELGILRLSVASFSGRRGVPPGHELASLFLEWASRNGGQMSAVGGGHLKLRYTTRDQADGEELIVHYWKFGTVTGDEQLRIAEFSYSIASKLEGAPAIARVLELLETELASAPFDPQVGGA